jgi:hypothetical protein
MALEQKFREPTRDCKSQRVIFVLPSADSNFSFISDNLHCGIRITISNVSISDAMCGINRPSHYIKVSSGMKADIKIWLSLLENFNGTCSFGQNIWLSNFVYKTKGRINPITRLDFEDFLFKIYTNALLSA